MLKDSPEVLTSCGLEPGLERHSLHMIGWIDQEHTTSHCKLRAYFLSLFFLESSIVGTKHDTFGFSRNILEFFISSVLPVKMIE